MTTIPTSKRLEFFEKTTREGSTDPLAWYGLAMEFKTLGRHDEALQAFMTLRTSTPDYVAMYLMCGQMLASLARKEDAREWLTAGIEAAEKKRDGHARGELETALATLDDDDA